MVYPSFGIEVTLGRGGGMYRPASEVTLGGGARKWPPIVVVAGGPCICAADGNAGRMAIAAARPTAATKRRKDLSHAFGFPNWLAPRIAPQCNPTRLMPESSYRLRDVRWSSP